MKPVAINTVHGGLASESKLLVFIAYIAFSNIMSFMMIFIQSNLSF